MWFSFYIYAKKKKITKFSNVKYIFLPDICFQHNCNVEDINCGYAFVLITVRMHVKFSLFNSGNCPLTNLNTFVKILPSVEACNVMPSRSFVRLQVWVPSKSWSASLKPYRTHDSMTPPRWKSNVLLDAERVGPWIHCSPM